MKRPQQIPFLKTDRTNLTLLQPSQAMLMYLYYLENQHFLKPWEPTRGEDYFSLTGWQNNLERFGRNFNHGISLNIAALNLSCTEVIGVANFSNIVGHPMNACYLGYSMSERYQGQGLMHEILSTLIPYMFNQYDLHRIMANHMPNNHRSAQLLKKLGFEQEGYAKSYLKINGKWQDHVLNALINPNESAL